MALLVVSAAALPAQSPVDWGNLVFPSAMSLQVGVTGPQVFGDVYKQGVTEAPGPAPGLVAELGYGPDGSDPATSQAWQWTAATFQLQLGNNEEYAATLSVPLAGVYDYAFRYRHNGSAWVHGDLDGSQNGYSPSQAGNLTVTGVMTPVDWGNLVFPTSLSLPSGTTSPSIFGRVFKAGVTEAPGPAAGLIAEVGYGPDGTNPAAPSWQWFPSTYNFQFGNEDEYGATLPAHLPGSYDYAFRYRFYGSAYVYGDLDGSQNGYAPAQAGALTVFGAGLPTQGSGCAGAVPLGIAILGSPTLGGAITSLITGLDGGIPFYLWTWGPPSQPLLPGCPCLVAGLSGWTFGFGSTILIPLQPGFLGAQLLAQGVELLPASGACPSPVLMNWSGIPTVTIQ